MKSIILLAPPAAGKGTQSNLLCKKYGFVHISTGNLLREAMQKDDEMGHSLKEQMKSGKLIGDDIIFQLLKDKFTTIEDSLGYILDGFPRNVNQAEEYNRLLDSKNQELSAVIYLSIDYDLAFKRIMGRVSCPKCGHVYNDIIEENQPSVKGICNDCQTELTKRSDDNEKTFQVRFETYLEQTEPLVAYYKEKGILYEVDSSLSTTEVFEQIKNIVDSL